MNSLSYAIERPEPHTEAGYGIYVNSSNEIAIAISYYNGTCYKKAYIENAITTEVYSSIACVVPIRKKVLLNEVGPSYEAGLIPIMYDEGYTSSPYCK